MQLYLLIYSLLYEEPFIWRARNRTTASNKDADVNSNEKQE
jgi:hypothetical protein